MGKINMQNLKPNSERTPEERRELARKAGKASGRKRKERKTIADALRKVLDEPLAKGSKQTRLDGIAIKAIKDLYDNPSVKKLKTLAEILGEFTQTIDAAGLTLNINTSEEGRENIERLMNEE